MVPVIDDYVLLFASIAETVNDDPATNRCSAGKQSLQLTSGGVLLRASDQTWCSGTGCVLELVYETLTDPVNERGDIERWGHSGSAK
jgi:hypothetical protein